MFDVDRIAHDGGRGELRVAFYRGRRTGRILKAERAPLDDELPSPIGELIVAGVLDVQIDDDADVGWYTVDCLEYDQAYGTLTLRSNIPLEITIRVRMLDVKLLRPHLSD